MCVFVKPGRPRHLETRLATWVGESGATAVADALLADLHESLLAFDWVVPILATDDLAAAPRYWRSSAVWDQGSGDLGLRLELVLRRAHVLGAGAIAVGADTPPIPAAWLNAAREDVSAGHAVMGPADDGGFYLLGLPRVPFGLLTNLRWGAVDTADRTRERLLAAGFTVRLLPRWFGVNRPADLARLRCLVEAGSLRAPHVTRMLRQLELGPGTGRPAPGAPGNLPVIPAPRSDRAHRWRPRPRNYQDS